MAASLFTFVELYARQLATAAHLLEKGVEHAKAIGVDPEEILDWRLIEDMNPLRFQIMVVVNISQQWPARVVGLPVPADVVDNLDLAGFRAAIAASMAFLATLTADQFAGRDEVPVTFEIGMGMKPTLPGGQWLTVFATTNLYFHLSTAYGILRAKGVPIGKPDLFAGGL